VHILILLFADDVALLSDSVIGLQTQLNILYDTAKRLGLVVNLEKSNIVVYRNGGHLAANESWHYGDNVLVVVNAYKYLGIFFCLHALVFLLVLKILPVAPERGWSQSLEHFGLLESIPQLYFLNCLIAKSCQY
jgi:hypothetical protein